jgi:UPF0755 protein
MKKAGLVILFLCVVGAVGGSRLIRLNNPGAIHPGTKADLYLKTDINLQQLSHILTDSLHMAANREQLIWAARLLGWRTFLSGHYRVDHNFTYNQFLLKVAKGSQDPISLTIIPGQWKSQIITTMAHRMRFDSAAISSVLQDSSFLAAKGLTSKTVVGHLFPNTYSLYWTSSPKSVVNHMLNEFNKRVLKPYSHRIHELDVPPGDIIILASIIQGEAAHNDEKPEISGLYWNRLKKGMPLQADPTVAYAVGERQRLYFKDYKADSPYNTYTHKGLPPGPINNPDLSSIKAALFPADNDYLYMVARPDGYHAFAKTYAKHQRQSKKWREYLKKQAEKASSDSTDYLR